MWTLHWGFLKLLNVQSHSTSATHAYVTMLAPFLYESVVIKVNTNTLESVVAQLKTFAGHSYSTALAKTAHLKSSLPLI